jgi:hypothetical protein
VAQLREQLRRFVAQLRQLLDDSLPLAQPAVGFGPRRAEHATKVFCEFLKLPRR